MPLNPHSRDCSLDKRVAPSSSRTYQQEIDRLCKCMPRNRFEDIQASLSSFLSNSSHSDKSIDLENFRGDKLELERKVNSIYTSKERRDRIGFVFSSMLTNLHPKFDQLEQPKGGKIAGYELFPYAKLFRQSEGQERRNVSEEEDEVMIEQPRQLTPLEEQQFVSVISEGVQSIKDQGFALAFNKGENRDLTIILTKDDSEIESQRLVVYVDVTRGKTYLESFTLDNKYNGTKSLILRRREMTIPEISELARKYQQH
eukprot:CAMPEP_0202958350 /NCGR_PEP_ID=MMETSP1396-20130829/2710_1 /ASSEMBLY_ACC=CAM_ASM_000872 /TAXON_ID= /ORGANISM="Pseudokeronopsis sp., Strain Brazil" /LENGTH=256 /DNA_ID=CAMNT_0049676393 /DNA_START=1155 /DNA_END=1925 /DNA_ORIENTATION=-